MAQEFLWTWNVHEWWHVLKKPPFNMAQTNNRLPALLPKWPQCLSLLWAFAPCNYLVLGRGFLIQSVKSQLQYVVIAHWVLGFPVGYVERGGPYLPWQAWQIRRIFSFWSSLTKSWSELVSNIATKSTFKNFQLKIYSFPGLVPPMFSY